MAHAYLQFMMYPSIDSTLALKGDVCGEVSRGGLRPSGYPDEPPGNHANYAYTQIARWDTSGKAARAVSLLDRKVYDNATIPRTIAAPVSRMLILSK